MADTTMHDLRRLADEGGYPDVPTILMRQAADEIEHLRASIDAIKACLDEARADDEVLSHVADLLWPERRAENSDGN